MFKNYVKVALRQLWKNKLFSAFNIFGLATSMAVCLLLMLIIADQYSYDEFHAQKNQIYRVVSSKKDKVYPISKPDYATTALSIAEPLRDDYPFIEHTVRITQVGTQFKVDQKKIETRGVGYAVDQSFFDVFDFGWVAGDQRTALLEPQSIVVTERTAANLFPEEDALGKTVELEDLGNFTIRGIIPEPPIRSHIRFDYLMSFSTILSFTTAEREAISIYGFDEINRGLVYLLLDKKTGRGQLDNALAELSAAYSAKDSKNNYLFAAQSLQDIMPSDDLSNEIGTGTPKMVIYFLLALGLIIITSACFNYTNLSIARSLKRAREIGVRKVTGARRKDIIFQFLTEAVLIAFFALGVAIGLLEFLIPAFYNLDPFVGETFHVKSTPVIYLWFLGFSLVVGLLAGLFPALNIAAFQPIQSLKKLANIKVFSRVGIRKVLITAQFALSLLFILTVIIVVRQQEQVLNADLGSNTEHLLNVRMQGSDYDLFAQRIQQISGVEGVSSSSNVILTGENNTTQVTFHNQTDSMQLLNSIVSSNYLDNLEIELIAGRGFPTSKNSRGEQFIILNETAVKRMGFDHPEEALGAVLLMDTVALSVIGVTRDFNHDNIWFSPIQPYAFRNSDQAQHNANVRLSGVNSKATLAAIKTAWQELEPENSFIAFFTDERVYYMNKFFRIGSRIIGFVGFLTILIACMGLLGMVIYTIEGRVKEVGIRKVLGATSRQLVWRLSKGFLILLIIAVVFAVPIALILGNFWLQNFYTRITIGPLLLLSGVVIILGIGLLTVIPQTYLAASNNPVKALRNE